MSNYTKPPWRVSEDVAHRVIDDFATIAHFNVSSRSSSEAAANARLGAAAPELLEALKGVTENDCTYWREAARAAIAKAEAL